VKAATNPDSVCLKEGEIIEISAGQIMKGPYRMSKESADSFNSSFKAAYGSYKPWYLKPKYMIPILAGAAVGGYFLVDAVVDDCTSCQVDVVR
jgi:hypothetical protein